MASCCQSFRVEVARPPRLLQGAVLTIIPEFHAFRLRALHKCISPGVPVFLPIGMQTPCPLVGLRRVTVSCLNCPDTPQCPKKTNRPCSGGHLRPTVQTWCITRT